MSDNDNFDTNAGNRVANAPYNAHHPVPTVKGYEEEQQHRQDLHQQVEQDTNVNEDSHRSIKSYLHLNEDARNGTLGQAGSPEPYDSHNRNSTTSEGNDSVSRNEHDNADPVESGNKKPNDEPTGMQQKVAEETDPRKKRRMFKHMKRDNQGRKVTDPVTHLQVTIHDATDQELENVPENPSAFGSEPRTATGPSGASKSDSQLRKEEEEIEAEHKGMQRLFPPPNMQATKEQIVLVYNKAITVGLSLTIIVSFMTIILSHLISSGGQRSWTGYIFTTGIIPFVGLVAGGAILWGLRDWLAHKVDDIWDDEIWEASKTQQDQQRDDSTTPESVQWLNSLLASVWPLINPDLFTSLADTLEDVMQASLPRLVRMVSVDDLGQGSETVRILGIKWLPTGAAANSVSVDGKIKPGNNNDSDRKAQGQGQVADNTKPDESEINKEEGKSTNDDNNGKEEESEKENIAEGMEAEVGNSVNMEVAFSYRATSSGKGLKKKVKNAHLFLEFYLPGGIKFPVWVEVQGIVGTLRMRLQLIPDPPFFALCTLTFLGQPKASLSCVPLTKHGLNLMDLPLISSFVQSSIDAALAEYVAPKSLTLDLKDMLDGPDYKRDTNAVGVIMIHVKKAIEFKEGNVNLGRLRKGSSDPYISIGWAKVGKVVWSTRIILDDMEPIWDETAFILVSSEELNADERIRLQLWDSDVHSADDDLGRVELDLKEIMHDTRYKGKMWDRTDGFVAMDADEDMPGSLEWSVGYFRKVKIQADQLARQSAEPEIKTIQQLKDKVSEQAERKLREDVEKDKSDEIELQQAQDLKTREEELVISSPPPEAYPSGILSIQVHSITGLQFERLNKNRGEGDEGDDTALDDTDLPSSYCTVILNQQKIFKTRTKPKNSKPFFNASTERMIRDWRSTEVIIAVSDSRLHEEDALLGIVYLPLGDQFRDRCQTVDNYPLVGGVGFGRARISMIFRSVQLQLPKELLGWDYGTLEITGPVTSKDLPDDLRGLRMKLRTSINRGKMYDNNNDGHWTSKKDRNVCLAVRKRYSSCMVIEFRKNRVVIDKTPAFAILWLKDIPDDEEKSVTLPVWAGDIDLKRAEHNCLESMGEKVGTIEVPLKLWQGLSSYHKRLISKNANLKDVFEVLDTASDNKEIRDIMDGSDSSDSDDLTSDVGSLVPKVIDSAVGQNQQDDGSRNPIQQLKDYKDHRTALHRQHRGIMQYKGARTVKWMKTKVDHGKDHIINRFQHHDRNPGIETET
ncbi:hypothetical protein MMC26_006774 [Xylographa opegraphella]|nr:hypothetical protein [Xylographa opegraphella]